MISQVLALGLTNPNAVKSDIEINCVRATDKPVVRDHLDPGRPDLLHRGHGGAGVLRGKDEYIDALGDQRFDIRFFDSGIALAEEHRNGIAGACKLVNQLAFILEPFWLSSCW